MPYFWSGLGQVASASAIVSAAASAVSSAAASLTTGSNVNNSWQSQVLILGPLLGTNWPQVVSTSQNIFNNAQNLGAFTLLPYLSILINPNPPTSLISQNAYSSLVSAAHLEDMASDLDRIQNENAVSKQMDDILAKASSLTSGWMGLYTAARPAQLNQLKVRWRAVVSSIGAVPLTFDGHQRLLARINDIQGATTISWPTIIWGSAGVAIVYPALRWVLEKGKAHAHKKIKKHLANRKKEV